MFVGNRFPQFRAVDTKCPCYPERQKRRCCHLHPCQYCDWALIYGFVTDDFSMRYVVEVSSAAQTPVLQNNSTLGVLCLVPSYSGSGCLPSLGVVVVLAKQKGNNRSSYRVFINPNRHCAAFLRCPRCWMDSRRLQTHLRNFLADK